MPAKSELYELIVETASEGIWIKNEDHITTFVNEKMARILDYNADEMVGKRFDSFVYAPDLPEMERRHDERLVGVTSGYEIRLVRKNGDILWCYINASPLLKDGQYIGSLGMVSDITEHKKRELLLKENERRYRSLFEDSPVPTWEEDFSQVKQYIDRLKAEGVKDIRAYFESNLEAVDECSRLMIVNDINKAVVRLNGAPDKDYVIRNYRKLSSSRSVKYAINQFEAIAKGETVCAFDAELRTFDDRTIHVRFKWSVVEGYEDTYGRIYLTTSDVTERIIAENERLRTSNLQKEMLLKEIHHRVKNNLQIITSLLRLQSNTINDEEVKDLFNVSLNRVNSMALVHDLLYRSRDLSRIEFYDYFSKMLDSVIESLKSPECEISTDIEVQGVSLNISTSIILGLLINEVVTNSVKHGFEGRNKGNLYIRIRRQKDDLYMLEVGDDGHGFQMTEDLEAIESLGLPLIHNLIDQLSGTVEKVDAEQGAHYRMFFKELKVDSGRNV